MKQGDPLSQYLFLFGAEALSYLLTCALVEGSLAGMLLTPRSPRLTHLLFADDAVIFAKATEEEAYTLMKVLNTFTQASGQKINISKLGITFKPQFPSPNLQDSHYPRPSLFRE
ncbi:hypothetical protein RJT34_08977 [Clitoria ternatea]|uniref:Reverse transcriptase domain-containing protein n=1 Tax=Clitoria ternatea TaxID=43366 RepID=A0AAN9K795_CLITE